MVEPAAQRWCAELADALAEVGRRVARLADRIVEDWADEQGRDWADRAGRLYRDLERDAVTAAELGRQLTSTPVDPGWSDDVVNSRGGPAGFADAPIGADPAATGTAGSTFPGRGTTRLGGTGGYRVDDDRGIRIAELPEPR